MTSGVTRRVFCQIAAAVPMAAAESRTAPRSFVLAAVSVLPQPWNKEANFRALEAYARKAAAQGAHLVIAPEGFLGGYVGNDKKTKDLTQDRYFAIGEPIDGPIMKRAAALARELGIHLSFGFAERRGQQMFNSSAIFDPQGKLALLYSKTHNAHDEPFNTKGSEFPVAETSLGRLGTLICYDRRLPETSRILAIKGAEVILAPSWGSYDEKNDAMMRTRAMENSVWVAFVHPQRVLIIDPNGNIAAQDDRSGNQLVSARIVLDRRVGSGPIRDRTPAIYGDLLRK
ncbi:MAG: carbon-nitrogen hydrolase family protein [Bryobacteraceae bacterium]